MSLDPRGSLSKAASTLLNAAAIAPGSQVQDVGLQGAEVLLAVVQGHPHRYVTHIILLDVLKMSSHSHM